MIGTALRIFAVFGFIVGGTVAVAEAVIHATDMGRSKPWRQCAAGTVPVLGKTLSGTVCVPGQLVAGDEVQ